MIEATVPATRGFKVFIAATYTEHPVLAWQIVTQGGITKVRPVTIFGHVDLVKDDTITDPDGVTWNLNIEK